MKSSEYEEILTSLQELTQRAYQLGRSEALKRVIEVMQADEGPTKPLALMAPAETASLPAPPPPPDDPVPEEIPVVAHEAARPAEPAGPVPWWSRPVRPLSAPVRGNGTFH